MRAINAAAYCSHCTRHSLVPRSSSLFASLHHLSTSKDEMKADFSFVSSFAFQSISNLGLPQKTIKRAALSSDPSLFDSLLNLAHAPANPSFSITPPTRFSQEHDDSLCSPASTSLLGTEIDIGGPLGIFDVTPLSCHNTYNPNVLKRKRTHGFLARMKLKSGRRVVNRRKTKGRYRLTA